MPYIYRKSGLKNYKQELKYAAYKKLNFTSEIMKWEVVKNDIVKKE